MMASTEAGMKWLHKALHPAEPSIAGVQIPDGTSLDTVPLELTMTYNINSGGAASPWGAQISLLPTITPLAVYLTDGAAAVPPTHVRYPNISGPTPDSDWATLMNNVEEIRLCGASCTIHLDANATTDQGSVVACQQSTKPLLIFPNQPTTGRACVPCAVWSYTVPFTTGDVPSYDNIMAQPRSYQNNAREGIYMPLRLSNTSQHWYSLRESRSTQCMNNLIFPVLTQYNLPAVAQNVWPFWLCTAAYVNAGNVYSPLLQPFMSDVCGHIVFKNLHQSSSLVVKVRTLLELKVQVQSPYLPHVKPAPTMDPQALESYFRIVRELDDAFPASFNADGKILGVLAKAIRTIGPALGAIPGWGPLISAAAVPVAKLAEKGSQYMAARPPQRRQKPKKKKGKGGNNPPRPPPANGGKPRAAPKVAIVRVDKPRQ